MNQSVEHPGLNCSSALQLYNDPVPARLGKAIRERNFGRRSIHVHAARRIGQRERRHGYGSRRMDVGEHRAIAADKGSVSGHAHIEFEILRHLAVWILNVKTKEHELLGYERPRIAIPNHPRATGERGLC